MAIAMTSLVDSPPFFAPGVDVGGEDVGVGLSSMGMARKIELVAIEFRGKVITFMHGISFQSA